MTSQRRRAHDPRILRAIAHPVRSRILDELHAAGPLRAADLARLLGVPANQASFHLRQLAKYGLIEPAPEEAHDGRDRVWRTVPGGMEINDAELQASPSGKAAMTVFMRNKASWAHLLVDRAFGAKRTKDTMYAVVTESLRLTKDEGEELTRELGDLLQRWSDRTRGSDAGRRTYAFFSTIQPYPEHGKDS